MLSNTQKKAIETQKQGFFYMYPHPVEWDLDHSIIVVSAKSSRRWWVFGFMLILNVILTFGCFYVPLTHLLLSKRPGYNIFLVGIYLAAGILTMDAVIFSYNAYKHRSIIECINQFVAMKRRLSIAFHRVRRDLFWDIVLFPCVLTTCVIPIIGVFIVPVIRLDAYYYIFNDIFGIPTITTYFVRVFLLIGCLETGRTLGLLALSAYAGADAIVVCLTTFTGFNLRKKLKLYNEMCVLWTLGKEAVRWYAAVGLSDIFSGSVVVYWIIIKGFHHLPLIMHFGTISCGIVAVFVTLLTMDVCTKVADYSNKLTRKCYMAAMLFHSHTMTSNKARKETKIQVMQARALRPIKIPYGDFLEIERQFCCEVSYNLVNWLLNALLLF
ncbi:unnamed protein product [Orchesella dallaii]|uniref:Odorant receptor n=1 Tax=Orchesella dallaii TaxID=48710 RepID=A0ABP1R651_9HEXA